ncbi:hypothetical protein BDV93DRAFT_518189 [Ceratobasidium sp. AG-I]|nr:hypothetical protein BDV93DRAFT_518189 [Ceratobasidium sp. AG-I]
MSNTNNITPNLSNAAMTQFHKTRSTLETPQDTCSSITTIDHLPAEILSYIFTYAKIYCSFERMSQRQGASPRCSRDNVSAVCVYWRSLSIKTPSLWSHIDLNISQNRYEQSSFCARCSLERAKQLPLYVHVECDSSIIDIQSVVAFLAPNAHKIVSLDLSVNSFEARSILLGLFSTDYQGSVFDLRLHDTESYALLEIDDERSLFPTGPLDPFLLSLQSLSLHGPVLEYSSPAFRGLTDLMIIPKDFFELMLEGIWTILVSCPELRSLALINVSLTDEGDWPVDAANLPNLEILDLRHTNFKDVNIITSYISPATSVLSMSLSLNMDESKYSDGDLTLLLPFFERCCVTRLLLDAGETQELDFRLVCQSLGSMVPSLEELALEGCILRCSPIEGCLLAERFPRLHTLHIMGESILVDKLKTVVAFSSIQTIRLRAHFPHPTNIPKALSTVVPFVSYSPSIPLNFKRFPREWPSTRYS